MRNISVIMVINKEADKILLCRRRKEPFQGLLDFVGGKREPGENGVECAYRELFEETGIAEDDITLQHVMDFTYCLEQKRIQVFAGQLWKKVKLKQEINELVWTDLKQDFCNTSMYANNGYIKHILANVSLDPETHLFCGLLD